ncbi:MAG: YceH family protein [Burkholderiales bacterium]|jgi:uncharacterized protein YceH (UPF0502 family)|nr:YceH family protein [Burkholderiales bacterium]
MRLTPVQARVVAVLVEKQHTVPDAYPLSLNALVTGCNQKNARDPVMDISEAEARDALDELRGKVLVIESSGARVTRYAHNMGRVLKIPSQAEALLATLILRGPQTTSELRINSERLHRFADTGSAEVFLEELATRPDAQGGALVVKLPRRPGEREARWAHLLCGEPPAPAPTPVELPSPGQRPNLESELAQLRGELEALRGEVNTLKEQMAQLVRMTSTQQPDRAA